MGVSICLNFFRVFVSNIKDDGSKTSHSKNQQTRGISKDRTGRHQREEDEKEEAEGREPRDGNGFRFRRPDADVDETGEEEEKEKEAGKIAGGGDDRRKSRCEGR